MAIDSFGIEILKSKYMLDGETKPHDVFERVARVVALPSAIHYLFGKIQEDNKPKQSTVFNAFSGKKFITRDMVTRVCLRNYYNVNSLFSDDQILQCEHIYAEKINEFLNMMHKLEFMPATPTLMNAGGDGMLSSCFFLRVEDNMEQIFDVVKQVAIISKRGGGVGLDVSNLRPSGSLVGAKHGCSSGPISFLKVFNEVGEQVKQGGARRSALLASLRVDHPDILDFIKCKEKEGDLSNFNISVFITDDFLQSVLDDTVITLKHPKAKENKAVRSREIWDAICEHAHRNGEPGILFDDKINYDQNLVQVFGKQGVNPCGELPLFSGESCNLGAINLSEFVHAGEFDFDAFDKTVRDSVDFLDNVVDINDYPLHDIEVATLRTRKLGLGVMGFHDCLLKLGIAYGSSACNAFINNVFGILKHTSHDQSETLGKCRGVPSDLKNLGYTRRNLTLTTCQPTGTVSAIAGCSSGIEPVFQWEYTRKDSFGIHVIKHFIKDQFEILPDYAKTATEIDPVDHVIVQAQIQKYIDSSISKTINLHGSATIEDVKKIYMMAWESNCKSITVYRSGSRKDEVLVSNKTQNEVPKPIEAINDPKPIENPLIMTHRPRVMFGATFKISTNPPLFITVNEDPSGRCLREVIINSAKSGSTVNAYTEALGRILSISLQNGVSVDDLVNQLEGIQSSLSSWDQGKLIKSVPDVIGKIIQEYSRRYLGFSSFIDEDSIGTDDADHIPNKTTNESYSGELCASCGEPLVMESGCCVCKSCGWSRCSS